MISFKSYILLTHLLSVKPVEIQTAVSPLSLASFTNVSLLSVAQKDCAVSTRPLCAGTSRGSHFMFDFYFHSRLNWPPEMWNFVKWEALGESWYRPAARLCGFVCEWWKKERKWVNQSQRVHRYLCVCFVIACVCPSVCVCVCVHASGELLALGWGALRMDSSDARGCAVHH